MLAGAGTGGQLWVEQVTDGSPLMEELGEPGARPAGKQCKAPDFALPLLLDTPKNRISARASALCSPDEDELWTESMDQAGNGWLAGPFSFDNESQVRAGGGPQLVNPAQRFGVSWGEKLMAVGNLKGTQTNCAAAGRTPVYPPTWDHFAAVIRYFQEWGHRHMTRNGDSRL